MISKGEQTKHRCEKLPVRRDRISKLSREPTVIGVRHALSDRIQQRSTVERQNPCPHLKGILRRQMGKLPRTVNFDTTARGCRVQANLNLDVPSLMVIPDGPRTPRNQLGATWSNRFGPCNFPGLPMALDQPIATPSPRTTCHSSLTPLPEKRPDWPPKHQELFCLGTVHP